MMLLASNLVILALGSLVCYDVYKKTSPAGCCREPEGTGSQLEVHWFALELVNLQCL